MKRTGVASYEQLGSPCNGYELLQRRSQWPSSGPGACSDQLCEPLLPRTESNNRLHVALAVQPIRYLTVAIGRPQFCAPASAWIYYGERCHPTAGCLIRKLLVLGGHRDRKLIL